MDESSGAIRVVSLSEDGADAAGQGGQWAVEEGAVRRVAEGAASQLPVAVVSVAGATRGGKSFLLGFFLRYLRAAPAARADGSWLGDPHAPLDGFHWRGGSDPDTTGIHLWGELIIATQEINGVSRKVAVLLMDTQGTFDKNSTVRDCTTIFALSTLMSSVQIYNIENLIREDHLHHLQLFTEYGKLACEQTKAKPFQSLVFRVKDWMFPYQLPYGADGGRRHLDKVFEIHSTENEMGELRQEILASFESVSCFLTPHPGFAVENPNFDGQLKDIRNEFHASMKEFVPSIFSPSNLKTKVINGQEICTGDLLAYFKSYMKVFNSSETPTPVSVFKATSIGDLDAATNAARALYGAQMSEMLPRGVGAGGVSRAHIAARGAAAGLFDARRLLAAPPLVAARRTTLLQELDNQLVNYENINTAKLQDAIYRSKDSYENYFKELQNGNPLCLHPDDVEEKHSTAIDRAIEVYDDLIQEPPPNETDPSRNELLKELQSKLRGLQESNKLVNEACVSEASAQYATSMQRALRGGAVGQDRLRAAHEAARRAALAALAARRSAASAHRHDPYHQDLDTKIDEQFSCISATNKTTNRSAKQAALFLYHEKMNGLWGGHGGCLHPGTLRREHNATKARALRELRDARATSEDDEEAAFLQDLEERYEELCRTNVDNNEELVRSSYAEYSRFMNSKCQPSLASILVLPWIKKVLVMMPKYHEEASSLATAHFKSKRRGESDYNDDSYYDDLKDQIASAFDVYCNPLRALAREVGVE